MLTENTGRAMLDSGDYYGRNWQRNQLKDLDREPASIIRAYVRNGELDYEITHSVYHWLSEKLTFEPELDAKLQRFAERRPEQGWLQIQEEFAELLAKDRPKRNATGLYGDGAPMVVNTYNGEDLLSQVLQYTYLELEPYGAVVLLSIHGGCDVRGGYTRPRAFVLNDECGIFDNARACLYPDVPASYYAQLKLPGMESAPEPPTWDSDNGCRFYPTEWGRKQLADYPASDNPEDRGQGIVFVDEDHNLYCPISGYKLCPSFF
jgi:hypothetical protein